MSSWEVHLFLCLSWRSTQLTISTWIPNWKRSSSTREIRLSNNLMLSPFSLPLEMKILPLFQHHLRRQSFSRSLHESPNGPDMKQKSALEFTQPAPRLSTNVQVCWVDGRMMCYWERSWVNIRPFCHSELTQGFGPQHALFVNERMWFDGWMSENGDRSSGSLDRRSSNRKMLGAAEAQDVMVRRVMVLNSQGAQETATESWQVNPRCPKLYLSQKIPPHLHLDHFFVPSGRSTCISHNNTAR